MNMQEQKIKKMQELFGLEQNGIIDNHTRSAVKNFNLRDGKGSDDTVNDEVIDRILRRGGVNVESEFDESLNFADSGDDVSTDIEETSTIYEEYMLDSDEYVNDKGRFKNKEYIFLHHTAGWNNPYRTIDSWNTDNRGRIGTHYVIGGSKITLEHDDEYDGLILKCIPDDYFAYHLGGTKRHGIDFTMQCTSIGIELCNFGYLIERNSKFYTYAGQIANESQIEDLGREFRGYRYWHKYSDKQIDNLYFLLRNLSKRFDINLNGGLKDWIASDSNSAFDFREEARDGHVKGILSHTNVRRDKFDVSPQKNLIEMIKSL